MRCSPLVDSEFLILAPHPTNQGSVHVHEYLIQFRFVKAPVIVNPAPDDRVEHPRQIFKGLVRLQMHAPVMNRLPHSLFRFITDCWGEIDEVLAISVLRPSRSKRIP